MTFEELLRDERRLGREEGRAEGREELLGELIRKKTAKGLAIKEIAEALEISVEELEKWRKE